MSFNVAQIDLTAATVGTKGNIPLGQAIPPPTIKQMMRPLQEQEGATLSVLNESGCVLLCTWPAAGKSFSLTAGQWKQLNVPPGEIELDYLVIGLIPNAPVSLLLADLYLPGEQIDDTGVLGNSPIGVSGAVSTSNIQTLKNDGNAPGTQIIEATPSDQGSSSVSINNDASGFLQVLSANMLRKIWNVVRGNAGAGKATITFGDSGDATITTLYGSLQGGQPANVGAITGTGANSLDGTNWKTDGSGNEQPQSIRTPTNSDRGIALKENVGSSAIEIDAVAPNGTARGLLLAGVDAAGALHEGLHLTGAGLVVAGASGTIEIQNGLQLDGAITKVNNVATAGNQGVPTVTAKNAITGNNGSLTNVVTFTTPNDGQNHIVRAAGGLLVGAGNTNNGIVTFSLNYTDAYDGAVNLAFNVYSQTNLISALAQAKGASIRVDERVSLVSPNTTVTIQYKNTAAGTISDSVWGIIELLA